MSSVLVRPLLVLSFLISPLSAIDAYGDEPNRLTNDERLLGWELLFDGKSLSGWRSYSGEEPTNWGVENGMIVTTSKRKGELVTKRQFGDFELTFEWRISVGGNSGVMYRVADGESRAGFSGPEYQILDNEKAKDNKIDSHLAGALYDLAPPAVAAGRPVGEWNRSRIQVQGWKIIHWLNDVKVVEVDLASPSGRALIHRSKFKDMPLFASHGEGSIALQNHGDLVAFRSLKIRRL